jgi:hypothetical protein
MRGTISNAARGLIHPARRLTTKGLAFMATPNVTSKTCSAGNECINPLGSILPATSVYFYRDNSKTDGLATTCKVCRKAQRHRWYVANREHALQYSAQWVKDNYEDKLAYLREWVELNADKVEEYKRKSHDKHRAEVNTRTAQWKSDNPEKVAAQQSVMIAVRRGDLPKVKTLSCSKCGRKAQHYHHWSYAPEHWLDVIPLCVPCHKTVHAEVIE